MKRNILVIFLLGIIGILLISFAAGGYYVYTTYIKGTEPPPVTDNSTETLSVVTFSSEDEFMAYLEESSSLSSNSMYRSLDAEESAMTGDMAIQAPDGIGAGGTDTPDRVSSTNVQVLGIDEPDIIKTDGINLFYSRPQWYYYKDYVFEESVEGEDVDTSNQPGTDVIKVFPPDEMAQISNIGDSGNMLLFDSTLVLLPENESKISGYDVSDPENPDTKWELELDSNSYITDARKYDSSLFIIVQTWIDSGAPCPIRPLMSKTVEVEEILCTDIYHPNVIFPTDVTYTVYKINPVTGFVEDTITLLGTYQSTIYMSPNNLYVSFTYTGNTADILLDFFIDNGEMLDSITVQKLRNLRSYDISQGSKMTEMEIILSNFYSRLDPDDRERLELDMENKADEYVANHIREIHKTGIVRIPVETFTIGATGTIPGYPLDQFSFDEFQGNLRVATTSSNSWWWFSSGTDSVNDVYVLDRDLDTVGSVQGLGLEETIYSVRFLGPQGYVVTFRQVDPFYVVDLSNPTSPTLSGELKIPGYSSYLHPLADGLILGVGEENWEAKLSLFDVSDPENPTEVSKYTLEQDWTEVESNHHAFLQDPEHEIFFIPGGANAYIFSYADGTIDLVKVVADVSPQRAIFVDDYLYVIAYDEIVVLDETTWERSSSLELD